MSHPDREPTLEEQIIQLYVEADAIDPSRYAKIDELRPVFNELITRYDLRNPATSERLKEVFRALKDRVVTYFEQQPEASARPLAADSRPTPIVQVESSSSPPAPAALPTPVRPVKPAATPPVRAPEPDFSRLLVPPAPRRDEPVKEAESSPVAEQLKRASGQIATLKFKSGETLRGYLTTPNDRGDRYLRHRTKRGDVLLERLIFPGTVVSVEPEEVMTDDDADLYPEITFTSPLHHAEPADDSDHERQLARERQRRSEALIPKARQLLGTMVMLSLEGKEPVFGTIVRHEFRQDRPSGHKGYLGDRLLLRLVDGEERWYDLGDLSDINEMWEPDEPGREPDLTDTLVGDRQKIEELRRSEEDLARDRGKGSEPPSRRKLPEEGQRRIGRGWTRGPLSRFIRQPFITKPHGGGLPVPNLYADPGPSSSRAGLHGQVGEYRGGGVGLHRSADPYFNEPPVFSGGDDWSGTEHIDDVESRRRSPSELARPKAEEPEEESEFEPISFREEISEPAAPVVERHATAPTSEAEAGWHGELGRLRAMLREWYQRGKIPATWEWDPNWGKYDDDTTFLSYLYLTVIEGNEGDPLRRLLNRERLTDEILYLAEDAGIVSAPKPEAEKVESAENPFAAMLGEADEIEARIQQLKAEIAEAEALERFGDLT